MLFRWTLCIAILAGLLGATPESLAQSRNPKIPLKKIPWEDLLERYLMKDCGTGDEDPSELLEAIVGLRERVRDRLLKTLRDGPDIAWKKQVALQARTDFKQLSAFIRSGGLDGIQEKEIVKAAHALREEAYVAARLRALDMGRRERALIALEKIGGPEVVKALTAMVKDPKIDPRLRRWIGEALKRLRKV